MPHVENSWSQETWVTAEWSWDDPRAFAAWNSVAWGDIGVVDNRIWRTWESAEFSWNSYQADERWSDSFVSRFVLTASEDFGVGEAESNNETRNIKGRVEFSESATLISREDGRIEVLERLPFVGHLGKALHQNFAEQFAIVGGKVVKKPAIVELANIGLGDEFDRAAKYKQVLREALALNELPIKRYRAKFAEAIDVYDEYLRRGNAVISDMTFFTGAFSDLDFKNAVDVGAPPGYDQFRDFIQGDYEYQEALYRTVMESINDDRAILTTMRLDIDVPDVFDRGRGSITPAQASAGIGVVFERRFHVVPEITVTMRGGTIVAIPHVVSATTNGFTVKLLNPSNGEGVAGDFTWAAHGY